MRSDRDSRTSGDTPAATHPPRGAALDRVHTAALFLWAFTFCLYFPTLFNGFIDNFDDNQYVTDNPMVQRGLRPKTVVWAFTTTHFSNWLPVTWLSHLHDVTLFGLRPAGHHATSAAIHATNAALLLAWLSRATSWYWRAVLVAAVFATHPVRVESVAWIAERKDVLAGLFFLLSLTAYSRYVRRPGGGRMGVVAFFHALGLMSKTMVVTLPLLLLLLDVWPYRRGTGDAAARHDARGQNWRKRITEKWPLFLLSGVAATWTVVLQQDAMDLGLDLTFGQRLANAVVAVPRYLWLHVDLLHYAVIYPHPGSWPLDVVAGSAALLIAITATVLLSARRRPALAVGWFWFLGMLVPVSGLVQVGNQAIADRYLYLPGIGLLIALASLLDTRSGPATDVERSGWPAPLRFIAATALLVVLAAFSVRQERFWQSPERLFRHTLAVTDGNYLAHNELAGILANKNRLAEARQEYERTLELKPTFVGAQYNLAKVLFGLGRHWESYAMLEPMLGSLPDDRKVIETLVKFHMADQDYADVLQLYDLAEKTHDGWTPDPIFRARAKRGAAGLPIEPNEDCEIVSPMSGPADTRPG